jgi:glycosyltransferase involved in cell wall biosynthesis
MPLSIAILGTRGIPANYGGFETFAQELGLRLVERGHQVTVYCRSHHTPRDLGTFQGVRLVVLPTIRHKYFDTVAHSLVSSLHALGARHDVVLLCNAINSSFIPLIKASGARVAINVDGLEWQRKKWNSLGKACYRVSEKIACLAADVIVSDSQTVRAYYRAVHRTPTVFIPYGAPTDKTERNGTLERFGLEAGKYILYVSRFEPENNAHLVLEAFKKVRTELKLVMVGDAPYAQRYIAELKKTAGPRVLFTGYVFGDSYRELMSHAYCYVHATEVGGTHPALVEAMGMGNGVLVADTPENREVVGDTALMFSLTEPESLAETIRFALEKADRLDELSGEARTRVSTLYSWDRVTDAYESLLLSLTQPDRVPDTPERVGST